MPNSLSQAARDSLARQYREERAKRDPSLTPSRTLTNASMPAGTLVAPVMRSARGDEAEQAQFIPSRGF